MRSLTARMLLVVLLVGTIAPAALAISARPEHACCKRKPLHDHAAQLRAEVCNHHECCRPLATTPWAAFKPAPSLHLINPAATPLRDSRPVHLTAGHTATRSVRGPPPSSIA